MLYTGKGDKGDTSIFGCDQRFSKSSAIAEALGTLDETNTFLGVCKVKSRDCTVRVDNTNIEKILENIQQNLFIVQAEIAGADKTISSEKVKEVEALIAWIEAKLPPIKNFFVPGGIELAALLDYVRTLVRRAERRVVAVAEEGIVRIGDDTLAYLNRLSSLLYALVRIVNHESGVRESAPDYR